ncbi:Type I Iterative PKS [Diaporthe australafricana]|uniref:Type I Iterative PKS n=1 Tax=Diaporthe australafricana TaxID=127596 RepID=A0ABR3W383_9PEZI
MSAERNEPIAIIGTGCRFPGSCNTASKLWDLVQDPHDVSREIPPERFNIDHFYHRVGNHHGTTNVRRAYLLDEDISHFDNQFFGIAPGEAEAIDPQQRLLLEVAYEAIDNAGLTLDGLHGSDTAVYVGIMCDDFRLQHSQDIDLLPTYNATGTASSNASSRVSYFFDWHGPSMTIDTACSSSLIALNQAVRTLREGTSKVAIAAGTNLALFPFAYVTESNLNMLSPEGRCHMWDEKADGYARGEGVAAVVLKPLNAALRDRDEIQCVIREIGVNHDGKTTGLTMPSASAQAALIRQVYASAGLDPCDPRDRCQFFEAHGTGTPAGDPQEAEALSLSFFSGAHHESNEKLFVGSIKTVIGHTEGAAGLAGVIKACQALKHGIIPPNLHFNKLNHKLEPFTRHLEVPTAALSWPSVPPGSPRRASVNSFGFGGANAHVILETYAPPSLTGFSQLTSYPLSNGSSSVSSSDNSRTASDGSSVATSNDRDTRPLIPFIFSAASQKSLIGYLHSMASYLAANADIDPIDLAHVVAAKKTSLPYRVAFHSNTTEELLSDIEAKLAAQDFESASSSDGVKGSAVVGVFTGQGAQWAGMGAELITSNPVAQSVIEELDRYLSALPEDHRPRWSLTRELSIRQLSRINEAEISQPLCTAVQIVLWDLLQLAGLKFTAVVGHSSGEIGAAYAAGFLRKSDAIRIAYYRGYYAHLAAGPTESGGGMMAIGTSVEDAKELCELEDFQGRISIAAHNSSNSITLSGDVDALEQVKSILEEEKKFARLLKVDTAYHSSHMLPCSKPYQEALEKCGINPLQPSRKNGPKWYSSVYEGRDMDNFGLDAQYWVDNMTKPVLFHTALSQCMSHTGPAVGLLVEIGPHPALKGPAVDTVEEAIGAKPLYSGTLIRGRDDLKALKEALGTIWTNLGPSSINLELFESSCYEERVAFTGIPALPPYSWQHDKKLWAEARSCRADRLQNTPYHDLLGKTVADGTSGDWRWKNVLKVQELPWLTGHALQGQTVFPGTGYIALAMEAAMQIAGNRNTKLIELLDLEIPKAISINNTIGTEVHTRMNVLRDPIAIDQEATTFDFSVCSALSSHDGTSLSVNCRGTVKISFLEPNDAMTGILPPRDQVPVGTSPVNVDQFYDSLRDDLGYKYEGPFRAITKLERASGFSTGAISRPQYEDGATKLVFHPALGDCALQGMYATISFPGDAVFDCELVNSGSGDALMPGDVSIYSPGFQEKLIHFEGMEFSPFAAATEKDDRLLFQKSLWCVPGPDGAAVIGDRRPTSWEKQKALDAERAAFFYLKNLHLSVNQEARSELPWYRQAMLEYCEMIYETVSSGRHEYANNWINDSHEDIVEMMDSYGDDADFNLTRAVGENLVRPELLSGAENILEYMTQEDLLGQYYQKAQGFEFSNESVARLVAQLATKFPGMHLCEIGAGTGGATKPILDKIGDLFSTYTYTDISNGFFEAGRQKVEKYQQRIIFKTLDIEKEPTDQDFRPHSFDCIVAANVLHATKSLEATLRNVRTLLKPGGYLVLYEGLGNEVMRFGAVMGGLPGWWVGRDDGRRWSPTVTLEEWDALFKKTGFSGVEASTPMIDKITVPHTIFCTMATSEDVDLLRNPSSSPRDTSEASSGTLILVGGATSTTSSMVRDLSVTLEPFFSSITVLETLTDADNVPGGATILSLADIDRPIFQDMTEARWASLQRMLGDAQSILWVTMGAYAQNPFAGMSVGLLRNLFYELLGTRVHLLDFATEQDIDVGRLTELTLQIHLMAHQWNERKIDPGSLLWTVEPEMRVQNGTLEMHRVLPDVEVNARLNSARRPITRMVEMSSCGLGIQLQAHGDAYVAKEIYTPAHASSVSPEYVTLEVTTSLMSSVKTTVGYCYVGVGRLLPIGETVLFLSSNNASKQALHNSWTCPTGFEDVVGRQYLSYVVGDLINQDVLNRLPEFGSLLAHEPDPGLASLLSKQASLRGQVANFTTSSDDWQHHMGNWIYLHERSSLHTIKSRLPSDVSLYLDASIGTNGQPGLASRINSALPESCEKLTLLALTGKAASTLPDKAPDSISRLLERAASFASSQTNGVPDGAPLDAFPFRRFLSTDSCPQNAVALVDWTSDQVVPVQYEPIVAFPHLFRDDRTYWLCGLSGDLGRSIANFMASHGARHIVLSSRNPSNQDGWVQWHLSNGVEVRFFQNDVTDFASLENVLTNIRADMPPLAGVANGAMVLCDKMFTQMSHDEFQRVARPKVVGTMNLDRLFSQDNPDPLDWFIVFSSLVATRGNPGQSNYAAANCFMKTLVSNRRARGLAGSSIDISRVVGIGYVERELQTEGRLTKEQKDRLVTGSLAMAMSETDVHQLFAEAVVAGRPGSALDHELITGIAPVLRETANMNLWPGNPVFGMLLREKEEVVSQAGLSTASVAVKSLLQEAKSEMEMMEILKDSISDKVKRALFMGPSDVLSQSTPLIDIGVDSLVGVDIRAWFMKELSVDVPVMKILGGACIEDLAENAKENWPAGFLETGVK